MHRSRAPAPRRRGRHCRTQAGVEVRFRHCGARRRGGTRLCRVQCLTLHRWLGSSSMWLRLGALADPRHSGDGRLDDAAASADHALRLEGLPVDGPACERGHVDLPSIESRSRGMLGRRRACHGARGANQRSVSKSPGQWTGNAAILWPRTFCCHGDLLSGAKRTNRCLRAACWKGTFLLPKEPVKLLAESRTGSSRIDRRALGIQRISPALGRLCSKQSGRPQRSCRISCRRLVWIISLVLEFWQTDGEKIRRRTGSFRATRLAQHLPHLCFGVEWVLPHPRRYAILGRYASSH